MPINKIQFQPGLSLPHFFAQFGTESQCKAALEKMRWPDGFICPDCGEMEYTAVQRGQLKLWQCRSCRKQTSLTAGTIFESTRLPLTLWFLGIYHLTQPKNNVSALELKRLLGVNYKAAWRLKHKLMQVMDEREEKRVLSERVEVDDAYLGGVHPGKAGRGAYGKNFTGQHYWSRGYYVSTVGRDEETVRNYIRHQEMEDRRIDQLDMF
ncbi:MAG TPA: IS1595 family transposase [Gammaproteobacteria bacterium]|nr:IS1595 family transposase [Gammaproteobacteria bacterium]